AERQQGTPGAVALGDRLENVKRGGETDAVIDRQRGTIDEVVVRVQDKPAAGFHRPALEHLDGAGAYRQLDDIAVGEYIELHQQVRKLDVAGRLVDDDAHGSFRRMCANIDQRTGKPLVLHGWHRNQHLAVKISAPRESKCGANGGTK